MSWNLRGTDVKATIWWDQHGDDEVREPTNDDLMEPAWRPWLSLSRAGTGLWLEGWSSEAKEQQHG